jgi:hypothetical protein
MRGELRAGQSRAHAVLQGEGRVGETAAVEFSLSIVERFALHRSVCQ